MKKLLYLIAISGFGLFPAIARAEERDSTGMPGDNFDLQGAMELFRTSKDPGSFEKALNEKKNAVNNLDLNGDGKIDYIAVLDKAEGTNHAIIMRVAINEKENQDVAVIAIQKQGDNKAQLQIIGNKDLYGEEVIMEPYAEETQQQQGPASITTSLQPAVVFVNVWSWPCVTYIYGPSYVYYYSPWYWGYYPSWWDPWAPYYWYDYYPRVVHYHHMYYHYAYACYVPAAQNVYYRHRTSSVIVNNRYADARRNYTPGSASAGRKTAAPAGRQADSPVRKQTAAPAGRQNTLQSRPVSPQARPAPGRQDNTRPVITTPENRNPSPAARPQPSQRPVVRPAEPQIRTAPRPAPSARPAPTQRSQPRPATSRPAPRRM